MVREKLLIHFGDARNYATGWGGLMESAPGNVYDYLRTEFVFPMWLVSGMEV